MMRIKIKLKPFPSFDSTSENIIMHLCRCHGQTVFKNMSVHVYAHSFQFLLFLSKVEVSCLYYK